MPRKIVEQLHPDQPIWGARQIAAAAGCFKKDGTPDERKAFDLIESGYFGDAVTKVGRQHVSTPRKILHAMFGEV